MTVRDSPGRLRRPWGRTRRLTDFPRVMTAILLGLAVGSCSGQSSTPVLGPTPPKTRGPTPDTSTGPSPSPSSSAATGLSIVSSASLKCGNFIGHDPPSADLEEVLGVVALPTSPRYAALQTTATAGTHPAVRLYAKTGLFIRTGTAFDLVVPDEARDMVSIGWDGNGLDKPSRRVTVSCPATTSPSGWKWLVYPGGYWAPRPACVPLVVRTRGKERLVHIGLGRPCPGQLAPQGHSDR